ncbi:MAG: rRNA cytosine-C5-methyltransferase [Prevotellaceae bacterium]|jgi:16S rRNA C967 or C1407 C5-methylase (RsmB/RsmF family)/NOL1/NOP2/fmu family ribosome biogenesis protein|nr:rRNA cytosine-C5-methyltransferase [Prevotellaceae bacterium]
MNLPEAFIRRTQPLLGKEFDDFCAALQAVPPVSVRLNTLKSEQAVSPERVPWCDTGYYLPTRPVFTLDPRFHGGAYYVQEASSMFVEQVLRQFVNRPVHALDLCAAPGGKSTHLAALLPEGSLLVSNEIVRSRAYILAENIAKWGAPHCVVTNNAPEDFGELSSMFDVVLVDAPCSGEGMFRKDAGAITEWSEHNVELCAARQRQLLQAAWATLAEGGLLIYSTCTFNREENEEQVEWICRELGAEKLSIEINPAWGVSVTNGGYRFYPHKTRGEGFFISALRKTASESPFRIKASKHADKFSKEQLALKSFVVSPEKYSLQLLGERFALFPAEHCELINFLQKKLRVFHAGVPLGLWKGKNFVPDAAPALSTALDKSQFVVAEVDTDTALRFLRTENIALPDTATGIVLVSYKGLGLGWVKNLGNRCNSLYPNEWRIRMNIN